MLTIVYLLIALLFMVFSFTCVLLFGCYLGMMVMWTAFWIFNQHNTSTARPIGRLLYRYYYPMVYNTAFVWFLATYLPYITELLPEG